MKVLGIMSGTSIDSVDYVICSFHAEGALKCQEHWCVAFPKELQDRLHQAASAQANSYEVAQLHHDLGRFYAKGARRAHSGRATDSVKLVGLHGQTIFHNPQKKAPATLQIGEPAYLAETLRVPVVNNFRAADLAAGGEGAPLATMFHVKAFARKGAHIAVNNIGGISNVTSIDWRKGKAPIIQAFDTGPGNMLIDMAARRLSHGKLSFDLNGRLAKSGMASAELVKTWLKHRFFKLRPPKSTGRELFGEPFFEEAWSQGRTLKLAEKDLLTSFVELTAQSIALNYKLHLSSVPEEIVLCGGGSRNPELVRRLENAVSSLGGAPRISTSESYGWKPETIEAAAFALLAWLTWNGQGGNLPETTGAKRERLLGQVTFP